MKKLLFVLLAMSLCFGVSAQEEKKQEKIRIAVMEFEEGVGLNASEVTGLSDMLINSLFKGGKFSIVERSQLNKVLSELNLQRNTEFSQKDLAKMGELLGVRALILGRVNFMASGKEVKDGIEVVKGEYNVDVRAVLCENGELITTAGATKTNDITYRALMEDIARQLNENLVVPEKVEPIFIPVVVEEEKVEKPKGPSKNKIFALGSYESFDCMETVKIGIGYGRKVNEKILVGARIECDCIYECIWPFVEGWYFLKPNAPTPVLEARFGYTENDFGNREEHRGGLYGGIGIGYYFSHSLLTANLAFLPDQGYHLYEHSCLGFELSYRLIFDLHFKEKK